MKPEPNTVIEGDCLEVMRAWPDALVDSIITDPPYGLSFMGKEWDHGIPGVPFWQEALRVAKPGAILLAFGGTRTFHRLACAIEDAGWEIRDCMMWLYGSGFPKSRNISKAIDKAAGAEREVRSEREEHNICRPSGGGDARLMTSAGRREMKTVQVTAPATEAAKKWDGWGTALKPAWEPIIVAMKPLDGTFAENSQKHGVAGLNIDGGRIAGKPWVAHDATGLARDKFFTKGPAAVVHKEPHLQGRWPSNFILSHTPGCVCRGVKRVKGSHNKPSEVGDGSGKLGTFAHSTLTVSHNAPNGTETVEKWECTPDCPVRMLDEQSGELAACGGPHKATAGQAINNTVYGEGWKRTDTITGQRGGASRFFYCAKASRAERNAGLEGMPEKAYRMNRPPDSDPDEVPMVNQNTHPTVKPLKLMEYLCKLTRTPTGGVVLDMFGGSGTTGMGAVRTGRPYILIEQDAENCEIARKRIAWAANPEPPEASLEMIDEPIGPLFTEEKHGSEA